MIVKKSFVVLIVSVVCLISCSQEPGKRPQTNILLPEDLPAHLEDTLKATTKAKGWMIQAGSRPFSHLDSLGQYSALVISSAKLNTLDFRSLNTLKRYLEAGGGGVVLVRDEPLEREGWPWLQSWDTLASEKELTQDQGRLYLLPVESPGEHLVEALTYAIGTNQYPDDDSVGTPAAPDSSRFTREVLTQGLDEPMQMAVLPDGDVLFVERKGAVKLYETTQEQLRTLAQLDVFSGIEEGLLGLAPDPKYSQNHWVYMYYSPSDTSVNRLSRMKLRNRELERSSEQVLLEIPTQRIHCCHSAGYLQFGPGGRLYLATGDNTNADDPYKIGYPPVDERPGHELADDQATAANTKDLRGKILRITPEPGGSYSIPEGNLFAPGSPKTRPEIYVMGLRNPFRFSVDPKTGILYWGEVGPNTIVAGSDGSNMSYDELNRAASPGFYGWPYFLGPNDAFPMYDFATGREGPRKDPARPINDSPNNSGLRELPPAQPAMIWYGPEPSEHFPLVGSGGASLMAGPVYYSDQYPGAPYRLPEYYDGKLFIYDWIRNWIMAVTLDEQGKYLRMEPFLDHMAFASPMDMQFGPDGALYVLEYGSNWFSKNVDAKLVRIAYQEGNRAPVAKIRADRTTGGVPLEVRLSAEGSKDYDEGDELQYRWEIGDDVHRGVRLTHTFERPGTHEVTLIAEDGQGGKGRETITIKAGNSPPEVQIRSTSNRSFYWDDTTLDYQVVVHDVEDDPVDTGDVRVSFGYLEDARNVPVILSGSASLEEMEQMKGKQLTAASDCSSCHALGSPSVGPSFRAVAERYRDKEGAGAYLAEKIIEGGSGVWGDRPMPPHPGVPAEEAREMVEYILSTTASGENRPLAGTVALEEHETGGAYLLSARYSDGGANGVGPLSDQDHIVLRSPRVEAEHYDEGNVNVAHIATENRGYVNGIGPGSYMMVAGRDLTQVQSVTYRMRPEGGGGTIELRLDSREGPLISSAAVPAGGASTDWQQITVGVKETHGVHDLYFVFTPAGEEDQQEICAVDWIYFGK